MGSRLVEDLALGKGNDEDSCVSGGILHRPHPSVDQPSESNPGREKSVCLNDTYTLVEACVKITSM